MCYWKTNQVLYYVIITVLISSLSACNNERQPASLFPIDSLITSHIYQLSGMKAGLFKEAMLGGQTDTITYFPKDTVAWVKELDVFRELEVINKPVNKGSYLIDNGLLDPGSNLTVKAFTSLRKLPVVYLKIYHQGNIYKPRKIEALYDEGNFLYRSARQLAMHFEQVGNKTVLTSYTVRGGQKMIFADSVTYFIKGQILVD